ncbi:peptidylprolyl isomerase [Luteimonas abyssi]|uniref:peptidylprolyl isomerase n=1 Tax=Luteimonas abyssi TaxID=1247514 RepID=UPI000737AD8F|nr:peptidylprolyl isomerase [Luteimonas abyssi]
MHATTLSVLGATAVLVGIAGIASAEAPPPAPTMQALLDASQPGDWRTPDPENLLYMDLDAGRVVIELAPQFAPEHVANIRALARGAFWDGTTVYRVQDNFVAQFGANVEDGAPPKPLGEARDHLPAEFERASDGLAFHPLADADGWAAEVGFVDGFPAARDADAGVSWMAHCYGVLGAGRGAEADSSNGTELYVVIGQSPRQLDRNITQVGRVLQGIELLSALPRGTGPLGFLEGEAQPTPIRAIRLAADVAADARTPLQVLRTDTPLFDAVVEARRNRSDDWYLRKAGHIDLCNVPLPVRTPAG